MSSPRVLIQILVVGSQIVGKAFWEAGRQAMKNAQYRPAAGMGGDVAGVGSATSGSATDMLTRQHRMTLDEAQLILNTRASDGMEGVLQKYEHLFRANAPAPPPETGKPPPKNPPAYSHYLQSKVVRAKERIEAELAAPKEAPGAPASAGTPPPPSASTAPTGSTSSTAGRGDAPPGGPSS